MARTCGMRSSGGTVPFFRRRVAHGVASLLALTTVSLARADLWIQNYNPARNDRFYSGSDKAFLGDQYAPALDFSGVGESSGGSWATMISSQYFVSAVHDHPSSGALTFYAGNSTSGTAYTYQVDSSFGLVIQNPDNTLSDLFLGRLTQAVAPNITYYPILSLDRPSDYLNRQIFVYGYNNRVGRNTIDGVPSNVLDSGSYVQATGANAVLGMQYIYNTGAAGLGADEAYLQSGDSGAPSFALWNSQLALVGVHYGITDASGVQNGDSSFDTFVPPYISELDSNMVGAQVTAVPEPATIAALVSGGAVLGLGWFWHRYSRRRQNHLGRMAVQGQEERTRPGPLSVRERTVVKRPVASAILRLPPTSHPIAPRTPHRISTPLAPAQLPTRAREAALGSLMGGQRGRVRRVRPGGPSPVPDRRNSGR